MLKEYDNDGDGQFSVEEEAIISNPETHSSQKYRFMLLAAFVAILVACVHVSMRV